MHAAIQLCRAKLKDIRGFSNGYPYRAYANRHRLVFVHIPKTGGTSILDALGASLNDRMHINWRIYRHANKYRFNQYYKFAVVRNPYERTLSTYNYLFRGGCGTSDRVLSEDIRRRAPTFEHFVMEYLSSSSLVLHNHFMPQAWFVCDELGSIMVDRIIRFENLDEEFSALAREQGWRTRTLPKRNIGAGEAAPLRMSADCENRIHELYRVDFDGFGYAREDPVDFEHPCDEASDLVQAGIGNSAPVKHMIDLHRTR